MVILITFCKKDHLDIVKEDADNSQHYWKTTGYGKNVLVETRIFNPARDYVWGYP